jgi:uncharacterized protein
MARAPVAGRCKTRLAAAVGPDRAAQIYGAMLLDTLSAFSTVGAARHVVLAAPDDDGVRALQAIAPAPWEVVAQRGEGLGARLACAFLDLGAEGAGVALVSSDSPTVSTAGVRDALSRTHAPRRALVGPCDDGGYYLIGLTSTQDGELGILDAIEWSTPRVLAQTRERCRKLGLVLEELAPGYDVDEPADLDRLRRELGRSPHLAPRTAEVLAEAAV